MAPVLAIEARAPLSRRADYGVDDVGGDIEVLHQGGGPHRPRPGDEQRQPRRVGYLQVALAAPGPLDVGVHVPRSDDGVVEARPVGLVVAAQELQHHRGEDGVDEQDRAEPPGLHDLPGAQGHAA